MIRRSSVRAHFHSDRRGLAASVLPAIMLRHGVRTPQLGWTFHNSATEHCLWFFFLGEMMSRLIRGARDLERLQVSPCDALRFWALPQSICQPFPRKIR
jgi:hypothetical protein